MQYKYFYTKRTAAKIRSFYRNVAKKYQHTYLIGRVAYVRQMPHGFGVITARCIGVDIRFVLFMMDKWGHADRLLKEIKSEKPLSNQ